MLLMPKCCCTVTIRGLFMTLLFLRCATTAVFSDTGVFKFAVIVLPVSGSIPVTGTEGLVSICCSVLIAAC
ncbi:hypothetical protein D3C87_1310830 [compost metagenome]